VNIRRDDEDVRRVMGGEMRGVENAVECDWNASLESPRLKTTSSNL
jgi:hypothetical protein